MFRKILRPMIYLQIMSVLLTGCTPTQPFFLHERGELAHYLKAATAIEYPDIDTPVLEDVRQSMNPLTLDNNEYQLWDLTLEDCISIALNNADILRTVNNGDNIRTAQLILSQQGEALPSVYQVAQTAALTQAFPLTVDGLGNRTLPRGALRANQVGGIEDALAEFDAQVSSFLAYNTTDQARNVPIVLAGVSPQQFRAWDGQQQLAISKRMATGGVATLRQQTLYSRNNTPLGSGRSVSSDWTAILEAQIQHPLMRNRGVMVNRLPVLLAATNEDISIAEFEQNVMSLINDVENAYWELYLAYQTVETERAGRDSAQVTARFAQVRLDSGNGTEQDLAQSEGQYWQFEARLRAALAGSNLPGSDPLGVYGRERALRFKLGLASTDGRLIRPITPPTVAQVHFDWCEIIPEGMLRSPHLRRQQYLVKQAELELIGARNQLLPDLDLSFTFRVRGTGDEFGPKDRVAPDFPSPGSSALGEFTQGDYTEGVVRLEFTPPAFGARREKGRVTGALIRKVAAEKALQDKEAALENTLADDIAKLTTYYRLMEANQANWMAEEREVTARLAENEAGTADINVVLQSQFRRAQAQLDYFRALVEYNKTIKQVHFDKGTLLDYNSISLAEGPWPQKAHWDALERARERDSGKFLKYGWTRPEVMRSGEVPQGTGIDGSSRGFGFLAAPASRRTQDDEAGDEARSLLEEDEPSRPPRARNSDQETAFQYGSPRPPRGIQPPAEIVRPPSPYRF
jgi:outer membrane protein TolC